MDGRMELSFGSALVLLVEVAVAALLQCASAKTTHVVGDSLGWTLIPDGPVTYSNWASSQTFTVGDILVFNFTTGEHDVAEVSKASFDACDGTSTIGSVINIGPASIILKSQGEHYFICTFIGHCSFSQKLAIKVTAASAPTNPPASPPSISSMPTPTPSEALKPTNAPVRSASPPFVSLSPMSTPTLSEAPKPVNPLHRNASPRTSPSPMLVSMPSKAPGPAKPLVGMASPPSMNLSPILAPNPSKAPGLANPPTRIASTPFVSLSPMSAPTLSEAPRPANPLHRNASPSTSPSPMLASMPSKAPGPSKPLVGMVSPPSMNLSPILAPTPSRAPGPANPPARIASPPFVSLSPMSAPTLSEAPSPANRLHRTASPSTSPSPMLSSMPSKAPGPAKPLVGMASPPLMNLSPVLAPTPSRALGPANPPARIASPPFVSPSSILAPALTREPATYVVGDNLGWTIPLGGPATYATWAIGKTFMVGDTLLFNFTSGEHDVAEVSKASFNACDGTSTIASIINSGPARITLSSIGEHYFICTFIEHCYFGQKLAIKVIDASAPTNSPTDSPTFVSPMIAMTPKASIAPTPANPTATFPPFVSPLLAPGPTNPLARIVSPTSISLSPMLAPVPSKATGPTKPPAGMASPPSINPSPILAPSISIAPGPANPPTRIASPTPSNSPSSMLAPTLARVPVTYLVGDSLGWTIPLGGPITYVTWAIGKTFMVGDTLLFEFLSGEHDVAEVPRLGFDACDPSSTIGPILDKGPANITLKSPGEHFFICTFSLHCSFGQKLAINVTTEPTAAMPPTLEALPPSISHSLPIPPIFAPSSSTTPSPSIRPTSAPSEAPETHTVGDSSGWVLPSGGPSVYVTWASRKTFAVGDTLLFNFVTGQHDVAEVSKSSFDSCNTTGIIGSPIKTGPARITLKSPGEHYFICTYAGHCQVGQKLAVNVTVTRATENPSSNPSSIAVSPSLLANAPSHTPSSASSLTIAGFSIASLTIFAYFFI